MAFKKNKVKVDLCSYPPYMFLAPKKFGKTTFWYNLVRDAWGDDDKGLLISFGRLSLIRWYSGRSCKGMGF